MGRFEFGVRNRWKDQNTKDFWFILFGFEYQKSDEYGRNTSVIFSLKLTLFNFDFKLKYHRKDYQTPRGVNFAT